MAAEPSARRFPVGLTLATLVAVGVLLGLGTWQVQRLGWKQDLIARIEASRTATPTPLATAVAEADSYDDLALSRVSVVCDAAQGSVASYSLVEGQIAWRVLTLCRTAAGPIVLERGVATASVASMTPPHVADVPAPAEAIGFLRRLEGAVLDAIEADTNWSDEVDTGGCEEFRRDCFPFYVSVETETPVAPALRPSPLPPQLTNNHLGYAITWYGLAAALIGVYVALLRKRLKS